jgi:hypothetical protein
MPVDRHLSPLRAGTAEQLLEGGQALSLTSGTPRLSRKSRWGWLEERRIQPESGNEGDRMNQRLAEMQQFQHGVATVRHQHQTPMGNQRRN